MIKSINTKVILPFLLGAVALTACDRDKEGAESDSLFGSNETILRYVPADTPYVFASVEPLSEALMDKLEPKMDRILTSYQTIIREIVRKKQAEQGANEPDSERIEQIAAIVDELSTLLSVEGMRDAGIGRDATGVLYGNGLLPVARWDLTDAALFDAAISRLEEEAGATFSVAAIEGGGYRYVDFDELRLIVAILGNQGLITIVPADSDDARIKAALGLTLPATSIADAGTLTTIAGKYGFASQFAGFVDIEAITAVFTQPQTGVNAALLAMRREAAPDLSPACTSEIQAMAGVVPRLVTGYNEIGPDRMRSTTILEMRGDIAKGLSTLTAPVPGLGGDKGGVMSFGMSLDVNAAREFVQARIDAIEADPYECEYFADLQAAAAGVQEGLNRPVPPMVYDFKGFLAVIDEIEGLDIAAQTPPTSVDGSFMVAMDNATALVSMGAMFSPELAELNLQPDGKPVALTLPQVQATGMSAFAALTESAIAIALGEGAAAELASLLAANTGATQPLFSFSMDAARYYSFIGDAMAATQSDDESGPSPEFRVAMKDIMLALADLYDRLTADVLLTPNGIEITSTLTLKD